MVRYLVVKTLKKSGRKSLCDNGANYVHRVTAIRHMHLNEMKKNAHLFTYEVMAIPTYMLSASSTVRLWIRDDEETRKEILQDYLKNA